MPYESYTYQVTSIKYIFVTTFVAQCRVWQLVLYYHYPHAVSDIYTHTTLENAYQGKKEEVETDLDLTMFSLKKYCVP